MSFDKIDERFDALKKTNKLEDEVNQILKTKETPYKPGQQNTTKVLNLFFFPRSIGDAAPDKPPTESSGSLWDIYSYNFYHLILVILYLLYSVIRTCEYLYRRIRLRLLELAYNPSQSPQLIRQDISKLEKIPTRVSTILSLKSEDEEGGGIDGLFNDAGEITSWCVASGIPHLTLYEYNGVLKQKVPELVAALNKSLSKYFGLSSPTFAIKIPRLDSITYGNGKNKSDGYVKEGKKVDIEISLLSSKDGKHTIAQLTRTIADLTLKKELQPKDITTDLVDSELSDLSGYEPDLIIFFGPELDLQGYPPWQIRLSELYWEPDNDSTSYAVFYNALKKFSTCKINIGK